MGGQILIIDDEEGIRFSLRGILEDDGHDVVEAESGEQGLELLGTDIPDMVFLDIWLPGMDGLEVLESITKDHEGLPVIMISGHGTIETAVKALKIGAFDSLKAAVSGKVVVATRNAIEFSRLRQETSRSRRASARNSPSS